MEPPSPVTLPRFFFKYRSLGDPQAQAFTRDIIVNNRLFWPSPLDFNDPFDCAPVTLFSGTQSEREEGFKRVIRKLFEGSESDFENMLEHAMQLSDEYLDAFGRDSLRGKMGAAAVCSLSEVGDSVLMWSHYSDAHRGVCLRFRRLNEDNGQPVVEADVHFELAMQVHYSEERPVLEMFRPETGPERTQKMLLTKADYWSYEREWRLISTKPSGVRGFPPRCLDAVILGARINPVARREVLNWIGQREFPVRVAQAVFDDRLFRLRFIEVDPPAPARSNRAD